MCDIKCLQLDEWCYKTKTDTQSYNPEPPHMQKSVKNIWGWVVFIFTLEMTSFQCTPLLINFAITFTIIKKKKITWAEHQWFKPVTLSSSGGRDQDQGWAGVVAQAVEHFPS
jgi:hypothetical protein